MYTSDMCLVSGEIVGTQDNRILVNGAVVVVLVSSPYHNEEMGFQETGMESASAETNV